MKRQTPFLSSFGFIMTILLLAVLGWMLWKRGGEAFSPGRLTAASLPGGELEGFTSHAEFEPDCSRCHQPLQTTQDRLCLDCHQEVVAQLQVQNGTHAHITQVNQCAACHADHRGRDFDPTRPAFDRFDHTLTHFSLVWHQVNYDASPMDCSGCHSLEPGFQAAVAHCAECHASKDQTFLAAHEKDFGADCLVCHDGADRMLAFDHQATRFPLQGQHVETSCADCHAQAARSKQSGAQQQAGFALLAAVDSPQARPGGPMPFEDTPTDCSACHAEPDLHRGMFAGSCADCHTPQAWSPAELDGALFEHSAQAGFSLERHQRGFDGQSISCNQCHQGSLQQFDIQSCLDCHSNDESAAAFMTQHLNENGPHCMDCHDGVDRMRYFDHASRFPLQGRHAELACQECHEEFVFRDTPAECVHCHAEPAIHTGFFGKQCQYCHTAETWTPARLRVHRFPLDHGGQGEIDCKTCHVQRYDELTCYGCHDHQPEPIQSSHLAAGITMDELPDCAKCHPDGLVESKP